MLAGLEQRRFQWRFSGTGHQFRFAMVVGTRLVFQVICDHLPVHFGGIGVAVFPAIAIGPAGMHPGGIGGDIEFDIFFSGRVGNIGARPDDRDVFPCDGGVDRHGGTRAVAAGGFGGTGRGHGSD